MKKYVKDYIISNIKIVVFVLSCIIIGIVMGIVIFKYSNSSIKEEIMNISNNSIDYIKSEEYGGINVLLNSFKINIPVVLIIYFSALTFIPLAIICTLSVIKGIQIGIYILLIFSTFGTIKGTVISFFVVIVPYLIYLISYIYICSNSLVINKKILDGSIKLYDYFSEIIRVIIGFSFFFFSSIIEQIALIFVVNKLL